MHGLFDADRLAPQELPHAQVHILHEHVPAHPRTASRLTSVARSQGDWRADRHVVVQGAPPEVLALKDQVPAGQVCLPLKLVARPAE